MVFERLRRQASLIRALDFESLKEDIIDEVTNPFFLPDMPEVTRFSQVMAAILLPFVVMITFTLVVSTHFIMVSILQYVEDTVVFPFLVTGVSLGAFIFGAWMWFIWVRTGGFGLFAM